MQSLLALSGLVILVYLTSAYAQEICSRKAKDFDKCFIKSVQASIPILKKGLPKYGVFSLDPLHIDVLDFSDSPGKTLNVKHKFKDVDLSGLGSTLVKDVRTDMNMPAIEVDSFMREPVILTGYYESVGKILSLPIRGDGRFNITLLDLTATLTMKGHNVKKNGKVYVQMDRVRFPFTVSKMILNFENLLKGNKEISDTLNNVLNENWQLVLDDMKESFQEAIGAAFKQIANRIFSKVPFTDIVKDY